MTQEEGAGAGTFKKKRRRLKHEVLQEGWGELLLRGGADQEEPGATLVEQEQPSTPREPSSTPSPVEQDTEQYTPGELPPTPTLRRSSITREQPLVQLEITTFMNPAPREQDWSTQQKRVASSPSPCHYSFNRGGGRTVKPGERSRTVWK